MAKEKDEKKDKDKRGKYTIKKSNIQLLINYLKSKDKNENTTH